jgi:hypothetical protein
MTTQAPYNFNVKLKSENGHEIGIDTAEQYGYWERPNGEEGGGLWFAPVELGKGVDTILELTDYDGTSVLSQGIVKALRDHGIVVGESFD